MGKRRRLTLQYTSDDDDDDGGGGGDNAAPEASKSTKPTAPGSSRPKRQQRHRTGDDKADLELVEEGKDENGLEEMRRDEKEEERWEDTQTRHRRGRKPERPAEESDEELEEKKAGAEEAEKEDGEDAVPIGDPVKVTGKGRTQRKHYASFEYEGNTYVLGDSVMFSPEQENEKPYVGIIKACDRDPVLRRLKISHIEYYQLQDQSIVLRTHIRFHLFPHREMTEEVCDQMIQFCQDC